MLGRLLVAEGNVAQVVQQAKISKFTAHLPSDLRRRGACSYQGFLFDVVIKDLQDEGQARALACRATERAQGLNETIHRSRPLRGGNVSAAHDGDPGGADFPSLIEAVQ